VSFLICVLAFLAIVAMYAIVMRSGRGLVKKEEKRQQQEVAWDLHDHTLEAMAASAPDTPRTRASTVNSLDTLDTKAPRMREVADDMLEDKDMETIAGLRPAKCALRRAALCRHHHAMLPRPLLAWVGDSRARACATRARRPNVTYKMKILITFFQIIVGLSFRPEYPYPTYFRSFISAFAFITFDFVPWQSLVLRASCGRFAAHFVGTCACDQGCLTPIDFYIKILVRSRRPAARGRGAS
jgi:hypothetical protein